MALLQCTYNAGVDGFNRQIVHRVTNLARLLPRLGRPGTAIAVRMCLEGAEAARDVLKALVGRYQENRLNISGVEPAGWEYSAPR